MWNPHLRGNILCVCLVMKKSVDMRSRFIHKNEYWYHRSKAIVCGGGCRIFGRNTLSFPENGRPDAPIVERYIVGGIMDMTFSILDDQAAENKLIENAAWMCSWLASLYNGPAVLVNSRWHVRYESLLVGMPILLLRACFPIWWKSVPRIFGPLR
jgi:hypothetical protein